MERLDKRLEKLQNLESKTSLKSVLRQSIASIAKFATDLLESRTKTRDSIKLSATEKQARKERQIARYGRSYREGLHSQIKEMKRNISILEQKQTEFRRYKGFVDKISTEIKKLAPSIAAPFEKQAPPRQVTNTEVNLKLCLKAEMMRSNIPKEYRVSASKEDGKPITSQAAVDKVLQTKSEPIRVDLKAVTKKSEFTKVEPTKPVQKEVKEIKEVRENPVIKEEKAPLQKEQPVRKEPMPVKIKEMEKELAKHKVKELKVPPKEERKNWFEPESKQTKLMTETINEKLERQRPIPQPKSPPVPEQSRPQEKFTEAKERPKTVSNREINEKVRTEGEAKEAAILQKWKALDKKGELHPPKSDYPHIEEKARSAFNSSTPVAEKPPPKPVSQFNAKSVFNTDAGTNSTLEQEADDTPEI